MYLDRWSGVAFPTISQGGVVSGLGIGHEGDATQCTTHKGNHRPFGIRSIRPAIGVLGLDTDITIIGNEHRTILRSCNLHQ